MSYTHFMDEHVFWLRLFSMYDYTLQCDTCNFVDPVQYIQLNIDVDVWCLKIQIYFLAKILNWWGRHGVESGFYYTCHFLATEFAQTIESYRFVATFYRLFRNWVENKNLLHSTSHHHHSLDTYVIKVYFLHSFTRKF